MNETQVRGFLEKGLPKLATSAINALFPLAFEASGRPSTDLTIDAQVTLSQLVYTRNLQVHAYLIMEGAHIFRLGQRVFPTHDRMESPKLIISANGELLNTLMGKTANFIGKAEDTAEVIATPPLVLNCSGENRIKIIGSDSLFLELVSADASILIIVSVQGI